MTVYQAWSNSGSFTPGSGTVTFDAVSARYLRFDVNGNRPDVDELETYNTSTGGLGQGTFVTSW